MLPVLVLGVVLVLVLRPREDQADPCDQLGDPMAVAACKAGRGIVGAAYELLADAWKGEDRNVGNVALNGPVTEWWDDDPLYLAAAGNLGRQAPTRYTDAVGPAGQKLPRRHANGCVPLPGHRDWQRCAPGTQSMATDSHPAYAHAGRPARNGYPAAPPRPGVAAAALGSGDPDRDGLSYRWDERLSPVDGRAGRGNVELEFPADVPPGSTAYVVAGEAVVCPAGTRVKGRDHRTDGGPVCAPASDVEAPPPAPAETGGCLTYWRLDGASVRDCREGATLPPGALTSPPLGRAGTARVASTAIVGSFR